MTMEGETLWVCHGFDDMARYDLVRDTGEFDFFSELGDEGNTEVMVSHSIISYPMNCWNES